MNKLNNTYVGMPIKEAKKKMIQVGYKVEIERQEGKRDRDILTQETVIQVLEKEEDTLLVRTSLFKKNI